MDLEGESPVDLIERMVELLLEAKEREREEGPIPGAFPPPQYEEEKKPGDSFRESGQRRHSSSSPRRGSFTCRGSALAAWGARAKTQVRVLPFRKLNPSSLAPPGSGKTRNRLSMR
eukprot:FR741085.1.p4 GENE.FR741085.1~~FR741085.1.p4  ORF type:complete len:116 (-),score=14.78 FR741085.1:215-562(-)